VVPIPHVNEVHEAFQDAGKAIEEVSVVCWSLIVALMPGLAAFS